MTVFPGRSLQAKKDLYREIASRLEKIGIKGNDILITLNEPPLENNWSSGRHELGRHGHPCGKGCSICHNAIA